MNRRRFIMGAGAAGIAAAIAGCSESQEPSPEPTRDGEEPSPEPTPGTPETEESLPYSDQFGTVVDLQEAGADGRADYSIVPVLRENLDDDTLLYLSPGHYLMDETIQYTEFENLGIVGRDAIIVPDDDFNDVFFDLGRPGEASGLLFEGITFDFNAPGAGSRPLSALVDDELVIRGLTATGTQSGGSGMLRVDVTDDDGSGIVERARLLDGAEPETQANGCLVGDENRGKIRFQNCHIAGFPDNGLYADPDDGSVEVAGGYFANCNVACIRVGNDSVVRGARVRCDTDRSEYGNMRGIRLTNASGALVEDCVVEITEVAGSDGGITFGKALASATVRNTRISVDADGINAIQVKHPESAPPDEPITFENVAITGAAANRFAVEVHQRENCTFEGVRIEQQGKDRGGFLFDDSSNAAIRDCRIEVTGRPLVTREDSTVNVTDSIPARLNDVADQSGGSDDS